MRGLLHRGLTRATEPAVLFSLVGALLLVVIWASTLRTVKIEQKNAERTAALETRRLLDTYEAQVVRALREIDQTLKLVRFRSEQRPAGAVLSELKDRALLPPGFLFAISIADRDGHIVEGTQPSGLQSVAGRDYFEILRDGDTFFVGSLPPGVTGSTRVQFSRRLSDASGAFEGAVILGVDAAYFVSDYESAKLGERGVLALLGIDGVSRVRRTGGSTVSGDRIDYAAMLQDADEPQMLPLISTSSWDGVPRWMAARKLYGFPLVILVGISRDERLDAVRRQTHTYVQWAWAGSLLATLVVTSLGRLSWRLARSRQRESEAQMAHARNVEYLAYHDGLTGLPNRALFGKLLAQSIAEAARYGRHLAVAFLDLDRFKQVNDTLGHDAGDALLKEVAVRLKSCVRESDTVARLGGDEFVVLFPEQADEQQLTSIARKILAATAKAFNLAGHEFRITASIGICTYPADGLDEQTLTKNADIAMYQAKTEGRNNFQFYSPLLSAQSLERLTLESNLRHALDRNEFRLHYQSKHDINTGKITGVEALLRWEHPDLGTVAPMRFLPVAEEMGLIVPIGKWVLRTACAQCAAWQAQGLPVTSISVNLTVQQFHDPHFLEDVKAILNATGLRPDLLELELRERLLTHDIDNTLRVVSGLKELGVRIAIDDFGTGYSSLAMLQQFPIDTIKIDRSITRDFVADKEKSGLAHAIIAMGKSLSLKVIAQGVETGEQAAQLRAHDCDELQGFYFNRPLPAELFSELLRSQGAAAGQVEKGRRLSSAQ